MMLKKKFRATECERCRQGEVAMMLKKKFRATECERCRQGEVAMMLTSLGQQKVEGVDRERLL